MRVIVLGAGLLGVASAYYLQQLGHEVTVVDRHASPAAKARGRVNRHEEGAAAQPAALSSSPAGTKRKESALYSRLRRHLARLLDRAIGERRKPDPFEHLVRLAAYSRESVRALSDEAGMPQSARTAGLLSLYTDTAAFEDRTARAAHWNRLGCEERLLSPEDALRIEPALQAMRIGLAGAAYAQDDPARDPAQFAASLVFLCRAAGVRFAMKHTVVSLHEREGRIDHVELRDAGGRPTAMRAQAYVLALGAAGAPHAQQLGIAMPLRHLREYIVTMPVKDAARAPRVTLRDRQGKLRIMRIETPAGDSLRVSGFARDRLDEEGEADSDRFDAILRRFEQLFPGAADTAHATLETVGHAVSRNGLPMIGKTRLPNLFLNTAPGAHGWVHVCGAGKSIARIMSGLRPELEFAFRGM
ncbi:D-amino acid dehydrogenase small subunit [Variovorax sp. SRS16]|uniref:FAD-dependent oxidoreductase n=1 Tax=Variovorax sp. SRS16 TaxID=282217 RepID=UPI001316B66D|nr:FAD-dependent oxidoreductase [Variovorax sp. SRS16]VTU13311.1 D-amino acid dehydrogenase small subunit [Variovorax sp. SRS16]